MIIRRITRAAVVAALYAALTLLLAPISFGPVQIRISEALSLLPVLFPEAIPGLFVGCLVANLIGAASIFDVVFGSLATLIAACLTYRLRERPLCAAAPPVLANALIVGLVLSLTVQGFPFPVAFLAVGAGQLVACYALGLPLLRMLRHIKF